MNRLNDSNMKFVYLTLFLLLCTGLFFLGRSTVKTTDAIVTKTVKTTDTVVKINRVETVKFIPQFYTLRDTVINERRVIDTIYYDSSFTPSGGLYVAEMDTTAADSSYSLKVLFNSFSPLDANSYFSFVLKTKEKTIREKETIYLERPKSLWDHFKPSINIAAGYGILSQKFEITVGLGISITP